MLTVEKYKPGFDDAYITWISDDKIAWTLNAAGVGASNVVEISARPIPQEPMVRPFLSDLFHLGLINRARST